MNSYRKKDALEKRKLAAELAFNRDNVTHLSNGDELKFRHKLPHKRKKENEIIEKHCEDHESKHSHFPEYHSPGIDLVGEPCYIVSFTKGLPHNYYSGLMLNPVHYKYFVRAIDSGDPRDFRDTPLGPDGRMGKLHNYEAPKSKWHSAKAQKGSDGTPVGLRAWESQSAGLAFDLEGPDAQSITMPPAPKLGSPELIAEVAEIYVQALSRDLPFNALSAGVIEQKYLNNDCKALPKNAVTNEPALSKDLCAEKMAVEELIKWTNELKKLDWFSDTELKLSPEEMARRCNRTCPIPSTAFRGITTGDDVGPYLSQFLLIGNGGINKKGGSDERSPADGYIDYGAISIDQRVRVAKPNQDYMTSWDEWFDVQNAANVSGLEEYVLASGKKRRFIHTPRDLATYVHFDALYEAYLNACLILLDKGIKFDPGIPFQDDDTRDHQQGFAHFGGPHILSLVTEVATRALKAVRFQKYNIHRRCRPEVMGARITKADKLDSITTEFQKMRDTIGTGKGTILEEIKNRNGALGDKSKDSNYLLPMAFCEGSPMHPAYGAGHATVAGACVTILKAFFDCNSLFKADGENADKAYVSVNDGKNLKLIDVFDRYGESACLTVEGELNKLASNISIGRNWAGVHYFTDYYESILMGEKIALGILEEQKIMFGENFSMTIPLFGGHTIRI